jgi:hypothetical protein
MGDVQDLRHVDGADLVGLGDQQPHDGTAGNIVDGHEQSTLTLVEDLGKALGQMFGGRILQGLAAEGPSVEIHRLGEFDVGVDVGAFGRADTHTHSSHEIALPFFNGRWTQP